MAYDYNKYKSVYMGLNDKQKQQWDTKYGNTADYQQFMNDYQNETRNNTVSNTNTKSNGTYVYNQNTGYYEQSSSTPKYTYGDTGGASNAQQYTGTGTSGGGNFQYSSSINTSKLPNSMLFGNNAASYEANNPGYLEKRNNAIANALYNEGKYDENSVRNYLNTFQDYRDYDTVGQNNTVTAIMKRMGSLINSQGGNNNGYNNTNGYNNSANDLNSRLQSEIWNNYENGKKGYSDLMGGGANYYGNFREAVEGKLQQAYGISDLDEFRRRYPEQYESMYQALQSVEGVWNATDPNERQMLDGRLQGIIGAGVGAGSDWSKISVLESSIMDKFKDPDRIKQDAQNVIKLQTEGKNTAEIASEMGIPEDQVQQLILLANGLDSKAGEYYQLKSEVAKDITEPYDTKMARLEEEKKIALDRANRNVEWLKDDFDTNLERQKQQNDINLHNADFLAGQYGYGMSRRGIEGLNYVATQAQQIIDDLTKNYDRNNQEMADGIADIIRNWQRNNEDLMKASQDALTNAKNAFTSNMLAIQQQYGTVGLQAQQALSNNVQSFIEQAETIYDNALTRQQQNLSNLITNVSNLNALAAQNLTLRNAKIQQFQSESMNLNRNQLQSLAQQLGMDQASYQDLVTYQAQAVANELNGYVTGSGVQFQDQIQSLLDQGYTPQQAMQSIMKSADFKAMQKLANGGSDKWSMSGGILYNQATGEYQNLNTVSDERGSAGGGTIYNKATGEVKTVGGKTVSTTNSDTGGYQRVDLQETPNVDTGIKNVYGSTVKLSPTVGSMFTEAYNALAAKGIELKVGDSYRSYETQKKAYEEDQAKPANQRKGVAAPGKSYHEIGQAIDVAQSQMNDPAVIQALLDAGFTRPVKSEPRHWSYGEGKDMFGGTPSNPALGEGGYDPSLTGYFENWFKLSKDDRANTLKEYGITQKEFNTQYNAYFDEKEKTEALENITKLRDTAQQLLDWNKKNSSKGPGSLHEGWADLETYKEGSYSYKGLWGLIQGKGQTKASEGIAMYNFLKNNQSLDKFLEAKKNGGTFGSMSNAEWQLLGGAASLLNWETNDKNFEEQLQNMIDEYDKAIAKIGGTGGSSKLKGTIDLANYGRTK